MHRICLAPVLSATLSRDSCWIMWLLRSLDDLDDAPALGRRQRAGLDNRHPVADAALVGLVVRLQLAGAAKDLAVQGVLHPVLDGHDDGLVHLVGDDEALPDLAPVDPRLRSARACLCHASSSSSSLTRAMMPSSR